jgi:hypothetical protein
MAMLPAGPSTVLAKDYVSGREALDDLDRLASLCALRLGAVRETRAGSEVLVARFLASLERHRSTREHMRRRLALPRGASPVFEGGAVEADLPGLRQALDDLMIAYAESLPIFGDSKAVSRLATDMVEVSRLRTVIDLWVVAEEA